MCEGCAKLQEIENQIKQYVVMNIMSRKANIGKHLEIAYLYLEIVSVIYSQNAAPHYMFKVKNTKSRKQLHMSEKEVICYLTDLELNTQHFYLFLEDLAKDNGFAGGHYCDVGGKYRIFQTILETCPRQYRYCIVHLENDESCLRSASCSDVRSFLIARGIDTEAFDYGLGVKKC